MPITFLEACTVAPDCYSIGPFFRDGVTVFKQQTRALNLVHCLEQDGCITGEKKSTNTRIAVIGGGVAGVTAAAAFAVLGNDVMLFEQRPFLCHLQNGCDTRWLHPHIYHWPDLGADSPYAALPLLPWEAGTASDVCEQLVDRFQQLTNEYTIDVKLGASTHISIDEKVVSWDNATRPNRGGKFDYDVAVLATGFGIETSVARGVDSYWRNDSVNQPKPGISSEKPVLYFISGTGDGGLIDLLRVKIESFNQAWIIDDLIKPEDNELVNGLRQLGDEWKAYKQTHSRKSRDPKWLFGKFRSMSSVLMLLDRLEPKIRHDTAAILNGNAKCFSDALNLDTASMFNCLMAFLLYELAAFNYVRGSCVEFTKDFVKIDQQPEDDRQSNHLSYQVDQSIIRHGTTKNQCLELVGLDPSQHIEDLCSKQSEPETDTGSTRLWPAGWPLAGARTEFSPAYSKGLATTFVSTLSEILIYEHKRTAVGNTSKIDFRIAMHRLAQVQTRFFFQQMSYYAGTSEERTKGDPGRIFDANTVGLVGLAARTGNPVILKRNSDWEPIWQKLNAGQEAGIRVAPQNIDSMIAIPIFYRSSSEPAVSLVLYMDSASKEFFDSEEVLERIFAGCKGLVRSMQLLVEQGVVKLASSSFNGFVGKKTQEDENLLQDFSDAIYFANPKVSEAYREALTAELPLHWDFHRA